MPRTCSYATTMLDYIKGAEVTSGVHASAETGQTSVVVDLWRDRGIERLPTEHAIEHVYDPRSDSWEEISVRWRCRQSLGRVCA